MSHPLPRVGIGVLVERDGRILIGKRRGAHGSGAWALPGGHLEFGETVEACAARELSEETGLVLGECARGPWVSTVFPESGLHYVTLFVVAHEVAGDPVCLEPEKCGGWEWHPWDALPEPLFPPLGELVRIRADGSWRGSPPSLEDPSLRSG